MYLYRLNILGDIVKMLEMFKFDPGVTSEVFGVITCLSNVTTFIEALSSKAVHKQVGVCISRWSFVTMVPLSTCTHVCFQIQGNELLIWLVLPTRNRSVSEPTCI